MDEFNKQLKEIGILEDKIEEVRSLPQVKKHLLNCTTFWLLFSFFSIYILSSTDNSSIQAITFMFLCFFTFSYGLKLIELFKELKQGLEIKQKLPSQNEILSQRGEFLKAAYDEDLFLHLENQCEQFRNSLIYSYNLKKRQKELKEFHDSYCTLLELKEQYSTQEVQNNENEQEKIFRNTLLHFEKHNELSTKLLGEYKKYSKSQQASTESNVNHQKTQQESNYIDFKKMY